LYVMPELPEVERFRHILLPLVREKKNGTATAVKFDLVGPAEKLPRKWVSPDDVHPMNNGKWFCRDVLRKGKQLCMVLENGKGEIRHFFLHMGMTGRLVSPEMACSSGQKYVSSNGEVWPPKFTYLVITSGKDKVAFADPRKFGGCHFGQPDGNGINNIYGISSSAFDELAPDGLLETSSPKQLEEMASTVANQRLGIKALILDQKRVVSGVGNWVADEVLYQCKIHPDQSYLTDEQALDVVKTLNTILNVAIDCLHQDLPFPDSWLFGYRWTGKQAGTDHRGRKLTFLTSGGRTSAIVASIQKLNKGQGKVKKTTSSRGSIGADANKNKGSKSTKSTKSKETKKTRVVKSKEKVKLSKKLPGKKRKRSGNKDAATKIAKVPSAASGQQRGTRSRKPCVRYTP